MMVSMNRYRLALSALALATLAFIIACGTSETATVTPPPAATSATAATLVPTLIPAATDAPAMEGPQGTINVAVDDLGPALFMLRTQSHRPGRFDTLVSHDTMFATTPDGKVIPRLVKEWSADSTGLILTFKLQEGVKWQQQYGDWGEFDADDFLFSIEDVSTEATPHPAHAKILQVFGCEECGLTKIDQYTIQLKRPEPTILVTWGSRAPVGVSMTFHSKRHFEAVGEEVATHEQSVGSGAWELIEHRPADRNILRAVPNHWRKTPNFEEMHWIAIGEPATKVANFLTGAIDTGQFTLEDVQTIKDEQDPDHKFMTFPGAAQAGVYLLGQNYNTDHPAHHPTPDGVAARIPLGDNAYDCSFPWVACDRDPSSEGWAKALKVRMAMSMAIDREKMVRNLAFGEGDPLYIWGWVTYETRLKQFGLDQLSVPFDLDRAKELMAEAGYPDGFEMEATLTGGASNVVTQAAATMWEEIGIRSTFTNIPYPAFRPQHVKRLSRGAWGSAGAPSSIEPLERAGILQNSDNSINFGYEHPVFQGLMEEAFTLVDTEERWAKEAEMARFQFDNMINIPMYSQNVVWPLGPKVDPWEPMAGEKDLFSNWEFAPHRK